MTHEIFDFLPVWSTRWFYPEPSFFAYREKIQPVAKIGQLPILPDFEFQNHPAAEMDVPFVARPIGFGRSRDRREDPARVRDRKNRMRIIANVCRGKRMPVKKLAGFSPGAGAARKISARDFAALRLNFSG